jgi:hypothetical protein
VLETKLRPITGQLNIAFDKVDLPLQAPPSRKDLEVQAAKSNMQGWIAKRMLTILDRGDKLPTHYSTPVSVWQFGSDLTLVGLAGSVNLIRPPKTSS